MEIGARRLKYLCATTVDRKVTIPKFKYWVEVEDLDGSDVDEEESE